MSASVCPECHNSIPLSAPAGQCPACLLKRGLEHAGFASPERAVTPPQGGRQILLTSEFIAPYFPQMEIIELLGQGGMGIVFKARQTKLDRLVAVKIIRSETASDPAFAERFMREARTLARLNHPNIVSVHDFGEINLTDVSADLSASGRTLFFFVMEYVDGANLRQLMQSGRMSPDLTLRIIEQVCDALQFAHEEGVVHRDIKPENIMLDTKGRVKIADFGLAKLADRSDIDWTLTGTHQVMGTPRYMAPEQLAGSRDVDHRADIYSLAVVFYEMLTGTIPVGHFALPSKKAAVNVRFDDVILKAMAGEPGERYQQVSELRADVDGIASGAAFGRTGESSAGLPGFSTILDRQVGVAWQMLTDRKPQQANAESMVSGHAMPFVGLAGLGMASLMFSLYWSSQAPDPGLPPDFGLRLVGIGSFALMAFLWIALPSRLQFSGWACWASLILAGHAIVTVLLSVAASRINGGAFDRFYAIPIICALSLVMLSLSCLRRVFFEGKAHSSSVSRTDSIVVTHGQLEQGILPDVCMICGEATSNRVTSSIEYQPKWAEAASFGGYVLGGIPGVIVQLLTSHKLQVTCPICNRHAGHWRNRYVFASIGWMLPPLLAGLGYLTGSQFPQINNNGVSTAMGASMAGVGWLCFLVPVIWMSWNVVRIEHISDGTTSEAQVSIRRVCTAFASEVRLRQAELRRSSGVK
jgi:predicted Ser/Thr protein kinase